MGEMRWKRCRTAILGAGSWGTSLGILLARKGIDVALIDPDPALAARMESARENSNFLPGFLFPPTLHVMYDIPRATAGRTTIVMAVPSQVFREVAAKLPVGGCPGADWVVATKGLEEGTGLRMSEVLREVKPGRSRLRPGRAEPGPRGRRRATHDGPGRRGRPSSGCAGPGSVSRPDLSGLHEQ